MLTVFDGLLPASLNPGIDIGAPVDVWTPTVSGLYQVMVQTPDEPGAPFMLKADVVVDMNGGGIQGALTGLAITGEGSLDAEAEEVGPWPALTAQLATGLGHDVRAVVKIRLVAGVDGSGVDTSMVVGLDELKRGLGIALADVTEDEDLVQLEAQAVAWLEEKLERRFQQPEARKVYEKGTGSSTLFLWGTVESLVAGAVVIRERSLGGGIWEALEDPTEVFEVRRGQRITKLERMDGSVWARGMEYEISFDDGYELAPADIRALLIDAVNQSRNALIAVADEGMVKSETIGDYSYTLDLSVSAGALAAGFSKPSEDTINRWRRVHR